jgi:hypothetical protein
LSKDQNKVARGGMHAAAERIAGLGRALLNRKLLDSAIAGRCFVFRHH